MKGTASAIQGSRFEQRVYLLRAWLEAQGDMVAELRVLARATTYDQTHPDEPSLRDELCAATAGDEYVAVAA